MSTGAAKAALNDSSRELLARWEQVRESWRDAKADQFRKDYLSGLGEDTTRALRVVDEMERLFAKIHADCE